MKKTILSLVHEVLARDESGNASGTLFSGHSAGGAVDTWLFTQPVGAVSI